MLPAWALAAAVAAGATTPPDALLALNPNISLVRCSGAAAMVLSPTMAAASQTVDYHGVLPAADALSLDPSAWCPGHLPVQPQLCLDVVAASTYTFYATDPTGTDTVMAISGGTGAPMCDDDSGGNMQPYLSVALEPGQYSLYVGSYGIGITGTATVTAYPVSW